MLSEPLESDFLLVLKEHLYDFIDFRLGLYAIVVVEPAISD